MTAPGEAPRHRLGAGSFTELLAQAHHGRRPHELDLEQYPLDAD